MHSWHDVKISRVTPTDFLAVIEISKGSKNKYELDKETGHLILDRVLFTSTHYPQNYGFIPPPSLKTIHSITAITILVKFLLTSWMKSNTSSWFINP